VLAAIVLHCALAWPATAQVPMRALCNGPSLKAPAIDSVQLMSDLAALADDSMEGRKLGTPGGSRARAFIAARFRAIGLDTLARGAVEAFPVQGGQAQGANVIGVVRGRSRPGRILLVTAHYDHLGVQDGTTYNGADDNASGTSAMMALAAWFRRNPPANTIVFVAFDGEEEGSVGAEAFMHDREVAADSVLLDINLDMVSRNAKGQLFAVGPKHYPGLALYLSRTACNAQVELMLGHDKGWQGSEDWTTQSDHVVFHKAGIPFIYFGVEDHPDYHQPTDDVLRIDPGFFASATRAIGLFVALVDANPAAAESARAAARKANTP
jgi:Zn-dependent M28 family amino/carboxypeptidase